MKGKIEVFIAKNLKWIILFASLVGFLAITREVFNKEIMDADILRLQNYL